MTAMAAAEQRILVTGAGGFVGTKLVSRLRKRFPDAEFFLADHTAKASITHEVDIADAEAVDDLIKETQPTILFHLAAVAAVASSFADPRYTWRTNALGTLNLVISISAHAPDCHFIFISSAEVYGRSTFAGRPVAENALLLPANPYAVTKAAADLLVQEAAGRSLFATILRPFNHTGPGQTTSFVVPAFCSQIARIEKGLQPPVIKVGELEDERDFLDVEDVVDAYVAVAERGRELPSGLVLNIASSQPRKIGDILQLLLSLSSVPIAVEVDHSRLRASRVPRIVGEASRARTLLNWHPTRDLTKTISDLLFYWRSHT
ncbi:MAG: NAD-dependent epimerase/dehydratase family protein [Verrucomicrobiaceae bacterium]|nr:MAG: NAD-dependent epimerase/dehydratase family protein [Verrucomicrobiaceae bacterium]